MGVEEDEGVGFFEGEIFCEEVERAGVIVLDVDGDRVRGEKRWEDDDDARGEEPTMANERH